MRVTATTSAYIKAPERVVYAVLTGYRQFEAWVPDITRSRLFAREGELAIAEFIAPPYGREKLVLEFVETPRDRVVFTQVDRLREDGVFGRFELVEADDGAGTMVKAILGAKVGLLRRLACRKRLRRVLERTMAALTDRAMKLLTSGLSDVPEQHAKLLELDISGKEITLRVGGTTYELVRRKEGTPA
jgi:hypothetical protein